MSCPTDHDCAICLQKCHHPTKLPCGHVFCFLCVKGVAIQSKKCAMCRAEIPADYLDNPVLLKILIPQTLTNECNMEYQWYYEGRNGWWKYDERSNLELENAFTNGETECHLLLAGAVYCIDFQSMLQVRRSDPTRRRHVRRDTPALPSKGIAGIKNVNSRLAEEVKSEDEENSNEEIINISNNSIENVNVLNTSEPLLDNLLDRFESINLEESPENVSIQRIESEDT